jgi:hypothetical protein
MDGEKINTPSPLYPPSVRFSCILQEDGPISRRIHRVPSEIHAQTPSSQLPDELHMLCDFRVLCNAGDLRCSSYTQIANLASDSGQSRRSHHV